MGMYEQTYATYAEELPFKKCFSYSVVLHLGLTASMLVGIWVQRSGEHWGGIGGGGDSSVTVNLVSNAGIPMPQPNMFADSHAVDPTKGLHKEELPPPPEIKTDAMKIPKFKEEKPLPPSRPSKVFERKTPEPDNAVNYGKGGNPSLPSGYSNTPGPIAGGGVAAKGQGGGDFGGRYPWYVQAMIRQINQNWFQNTIDPSVRNTAHATATFTINRDGSVKNVRISQSSGNASYDNSALRALQSVDHFPALPADYSGTYVDVTFEFMPPGAAAPR